MALLGAYVDEIKFLGLLVIAISLFVNSEVDGMKLGKEISHLDTQERSKPLTILDITARTCDYAECSWPWQCSGYPACRCVYVSSLGKSVCKRSPSG